MRAIGSWIACTAALCWGSSLSVGAPSAGNLVRDGACEQTRTYELPQNKYMHRAVQNGWKLSGTDERVVVPVVLDQFCGKDGTLKVVRGTAPADVHSGKGAIVVHGQFYLKRVDANAYKTREGDEFIVRYYAKGRGQTRAYMHVYGEGRVAAEDVSCRGKPQPGRWTLIEQRLRIVGPGAKGIAVRLWASQPMRIDDIQVRRYVEEKAIIQAGRPVATHELAKVTCAPRTKTAPTIDGRLDEACWRAAPPAGVFLDYSQQDHAARPETLVRATYDARHLYVGVECMDPDLSILSILDPYKDVKGEKFLGKNSVELFLDCANNKIDYYQFVSTARCHRYDGFKHDANWTGVWEVRSHVGTDRWSLEFRIPFRTLGTRTPKPADTWGLNVCRNRRRIHSTWSPVGNQFHNPDLFGKLVFGTYQDWYRLVLLRKQKSLADQVRRDAGALASQRVADRLRHVESYSTDLADELGKSGFPKTWDAFLRLYAKGSFVVESIEDLCIEIEWLRAAGRVAPAKRNTP